MRSGNQTVTSRELSWYFGHYTFSFGVNESQILFGAASPTLFLFFFPGIMNGSFNPPRFLAGSGMLFVKYQHLSPIIAALRVF